MQHRTLLLPLSRSNSPPPSPLTVISTAEKAWEKKHELSFATQCRVFQHHLKILLLSERSSSSTSADVRQSLSLGSRTTAEPRRPLFCSFFGSAVCLFLLRVHLSVHTDIPQKENLKKPTQAPKQKHIAWLGDRGPRAAATVVLFLSITVFLCPCTFSSQHTSLLVRFLPDARSNQKTEGKDSTNMHDRRRHKIDSKDMVRAIARPTFLAGPLVWSQ